MLPSVDGLTCVSDSEEMKNIKYTNIDDNSFGGLKDKVTGFNSELMTTLLNHLI